MKTIWLISTALVLWSASASAQTADATGTDTVVTHGMGNDRKSFSPLKEINTSTVKRLVPVWSLSLQNELGELASPAVQDGVMYMVNGKWTVAVNIETGKMLWRTPVESDPQMKRANAFNRGGPVLYHGKLFRVTIDNHVIALDMKTGKQVWKQKFADWREGYNASSAPIIANGVLISGMAGGESTTRGFLDGWDPDTGKKLWRRYTIPAPGEPGSETWPKDLDAWTRGGGPTWRSGSYDPELDLVYWGTGNAEPYDPRPREQLDSLYTSSVIAIRPKTGEIACFYQYTPNDVYDVDGADENVLADIPINGQMRKVMIQANKNGFMYVLDRTNCKLIAAHAFTKVNWATHVDLATGRPVLTDVYKKFLAGEEVEIWPQRGTNAVPIAYNPATGLIYMSSWSLPRVQKLAKQKPQVVGENSTGVEARNLPVKPGDVVGYWLAINPLTGEKKWEVPITDIPISAGTLATAGGLVFSGLLTGEFIALDAATGKTVWQFRTGSAINSTAITYTHKGKQYVSIASGLGGILAKRFAPKSVPAGGAIWTFALMPE